MSNLQIFHKYHVYIKLKTEHSSRFLRCIWHTKSKKLEGKISTTKKHIIKGLVLYFKNLIHLSFLFLPGVNVYFSPYFTHNAQQVTKKYVTHK